jgi:polysaccharide biosynthesis transport protein
MDEEIQEQPEQHRDFEWYLSILRRRHVHFLISLLVGWLAVWGASWIIPPRYKSNTLILVEQPTMPKNYVEPNVGGNLQDRLQSITQQILSRTHLLSIIKKLHLYENTRGVNSVDDMIALMRKDIDIEVVRDPQNDQISAFRIFYSARNPYVARTVTAELTDLFIKENLQSRQQQSEDTTKFLQAQLANAQENLADQEIKVREFQAQHEGELPTQQASNLQILSGLQSQLQNEQDALNTARQQRVYFQAMIDQYRGAHSTDGVDGTSSITAVDQELVQLRTRLAELRSKYTERYPDVVALQDQIATKEQLRERLQAEDKKSSAGAGQTRQTTNAAAKLDHPMSAVLAQLQGQLESNRLEIENRDKSITSLKARIGSYQARLNAEPQAEQQLAVLTRGYEQSKENYDDLLKKESGSKMATSMELMQQGQRFTMLDPPSLPSKPDFPNRLKFCGYGLIAGLGLGMIVVAAFEFFDDRVQTELQIRSMLPVNVIWDIPLVQSERDLKKAKVQFGLRLLGGALVAMIILAGAVTSYLRG